MSTTGLAETALPPDIFRGLQPIRSDAERATAAWNAAMANQAVALEAQGVSPRDIFLQTRTWRGQDGKLRQEAFAALPERRASTMPGFGQPSVPGEFLGGFVGGPQRFSVMDPEAQRLQAARDVGQQASVASELYGAASPFAIASTMARRGQMMGVSPLTVFQGSPHRFTKLDSSKIGTGEGGQAYGYGLYFAENPKVAETYAYGVANKQFMETLKKLSNSQDIVDKATAAKIFYDDNETLAQFIKNKQQDLTESQVNQIMQRANTQYNKLRQEGGNLYKVDLPDQLIDRMLDWDKPLSQQAPGVIAALERSKNKDIRMMRLYASTPHSEALGGDEKTMGEAFHFLNLNIAGKYNSPKASALLAKQGIPGIKYLDQGSRGAGAGTRNFVVFPGEEEALTILSRD